VAEVARTRTTETKEAQKMRKWKPPTIPSKCDSVKRAIKTLHESKRRAASGRNKKESKPTQQTELKIGNLDYLREESVRGETF